MPYGRYRKKRKYSRRNYRKSRKYRKRRNYRRRRKYSRRPRRSRIQNFAKDAAIRQRAYRLTYSSSSSQNTNAGTTMIQWADWSCNNIYDPDVTGIGEQPMGFDQLATRYHHWAVAASKITVTAYPVTALGAVPYAICSCVNWDDSDHTKIMPDYLVDAREMPYVKVKEATAIRTQMKLVMTNGWSARKQYGAGWVVQGGHWHDFDTVPTSLNPIHFNVGIVSNGGSVNAELEIRVKIDYTIIVRHPRTIMGS